MPSKSTVLINRSTNPTEEEPKPTPPETKPEPSPKPEPEPKASKIELDGLHSFLQSDFPHHKLATAEEKPKPPEDEDETPPEESPKPKAKKPVVKAKPKAEPPTPAPLSAEQIAEAAARGVVKGMAETKPEPAKPEAPKLDPDEEAKVEVLKHMETLWPDKYKGLSDKYLKGMRAIDEYAKKWEADHPGQEFDEKDADHEKVFHDNDVDYTDKDFRSAEISLYSKPLVDTATAEARQRIADLERKVKLQDSAREIAGHQITAAKAFWSKLGKEFEDIILPNGQSNDAKLTELAKSDPNTVTRIQAAQLLDTEVTEAYKLFNALAPFDEKNRVHVELSNFMLQKEKDMMALPYEDRTDTEGRQFLPEAQYRKLSKEAKETHWTFTLQDVIDMRTGYIAKSVKTRIDNEESAHRAWAKARGIEIPEPGKPSAAATSTDQELTPMEEAERSRRREKPHGPSFMADTRGGATRSAPGGEPQRNALDVRNVL